MKFYSQNGEDYLLWEFFDHKPTGFFIDVGAFDGIHLSNTYAFEQIGWTGICIEPHPEYFPLCSNNRKRSLCLQVACVSDDQNQFVDFFAEETGLLSGLNTEDNIADIQNRYNARKLEFTGIRKVTVLCKALNSIIQECSCQNVNIDFVSIDVEGTELDVLKSIDLNRYLPRVIVIEANTEKEKSELESFLHENSDYKLARSLKVNNFFARTNDDVYKLQSIAINCIIEKQLHPKGQKYTLKKYLDNLIIN